MGDARLPQNERSLTKQRRIAHAEASDRRAIASLYGLRKIGGTHQIPVDLAGGFASFVDGPDDE